MNPKFYLIAVLFLPLLFGCQSTSPKSQWSDLIKAGQFTKADSTLQSYLAENGSKLSDEDRQDLIWQQEWMKRVRIDYPYNRADIIRQMQKRIADFQPAEFDRWMSEDKFDFRVINGDTLFLYPSVSNLFFRYPDIAKRRLPKPDNSKYEQYFWNNYAKIMEAGKDNPNSTVVPVKFRVHFTITVDPNAAPADETIRCWMPYPRIYAQQTDMKLEESSPQVKWVDRPDSPIRSLYFEQPAAADQPTVFKATYSYTAYSTHHKIDVDKVQRVSLNDSTLKPYMSEQPPHVVFTPELIGLAKKIVGNQKNPYLQAKALYEWVAKNIQYSYAAEYSTIPNISMYTFNHGYGDCGQEALLYITLARSLGIPARWQSGWYIMPGGKTIHDWTEIYIAPYGWIPVEPYMGIKTQQYMDTLTQEQQDTLTDFYFGNIDAYRLMANCNQNQKLYPAKKYFRSDNVDFQRGEVEWKGGNIYFNQFSYSLNVEILDQ
ncbi:MAG: transglutaminase-like domain-containing protein [Calditrichia bacterium]